MSEFLVVHSKDSAERFDYAADPERLISGTFSQSFFENYATEGDKISTGIWECTAGALTINYVNHEFCHIIRGRVALIDEQGARTEFGPGESFMITPGFKGVWETIEDCAKYYVLIRS
jgi:uncharacterized cupin superfamily protein